MTIGAATGTGNITSASNTSATSLTANKPANTVTGDLLWAVVYFRSTGTPVYTVPSGWTLAKSDGGNASFGLWLKPITNAATEPANYTFSVSGVAAGRCVMAIGRITGADLSAPLDAAGAVSAYTGTTSLTLPSMNAVHGGCLLLAIATCNNNTTTVPVFTLAPGMTGTTQQSIVVPSTNCSAFQVGQQVLTASGATGDRVPTMSPAAQNSAGFLVTIKASTTTKALGRVTRTASVRTLAASRIHALGRAVGAGEARALGADLVNVANRVTSVGEARPLSVWKSAPGHVQMPALSIQAAFSVGADTGTLLHLDDPTRGKLDVGTLGDGTAEEPTWEELGARATEGDCQIIRGSTRVDSPLIVYETGTASVPLDNHDRALDPTNLNGPYVDPVNLKSRVVAMRAVRIRATWADTVYELFRGTADAWNVEWHDPGASVTTLTASDGFKVLSGISRGAGVAVGAGELTGARINRILDSAGWASDDRMIDAGETTVQATTLEGEVLAELQLVAATAIGELYVDGGGRIIFRRRNALLVDPRSATSQATFGDAGDELPYTELGIANDDATFFNEIRVTRASSGAGDEPVEQVAANTGSQAVNYRRTWTADVAPILQNDAETARWARWLLGLASEPETRFTDITIAPAMQPADLWQHALGRQIGDRITIVRRPPGGGDPIVRDCIIRGIEHTFGREAWSTKWTLQDASRIGGYLILDDTLLGVLDANKLAF